MVQDTRFGEFPFVDTEADEESEPDGKNHINANVPPAVCPSEGDANQHESETARQ